MTSLGGRASRALFSTGKLGTLTLTMTDANPSDTTTIADLVSAYIHPCAACMYVCTHVCMYVCMYLRIYVRMYVCMYVCMIVCMYVCMYVCLHV